MRSGHYRTAASTLAEQIVPMRTTILVFSSIVAVTCGSAWANLSLKSTMRSWKAEAATMDRMLIATALDRALTVITDDEVFGRYGVSTVW